MSERERTRLRGRIGFVSRRSGCFILCRPGECHDGCRNFRGAVSARNGRASSRISASADKLHLKRMRLAAARNKGSLSRERCYQSRASCWPMKRPLCWIFKPGARSARFSGNSPRPAATVVVSRTTIDEETHTDRRPQRRMFADGKTCYGERLLPSLERARVFAALLLRF